MPGNVPNVLAIPNISPENIPPISFILTNGPADQKNPL